MGIAHQKCASWDSYHGNFSSAQIPTRLEPFSLDCSDGHHPDGVTIIPWKSGRLMVWDAICPDSFAPSYVASGTSAAGAVAEDRKRTKYSYLDPGHTFIPIAIETSGAFGLSASSFFKELDHCVSQVTVETNLCLSLSEGFHSCSAKQHSLSYGHLRPIDFPPYLIIIIIIIINLFFSLIVIDYM